MSIDKACHNKVAIYSKSNLDLSIKRAILDDVAQADPRAKQIKAVDLYDRRFLDEMEKSGFFDKLWAGATNR